MITNCNLKIQCSIVIWKPVENSKQFALKIPSLTIMNKMAGYWPLAAAAKGQKQAN